MDELPPCTSFVDLAAGFLLRFGAMTRDLVRSVQFLTVGFLAYLLPTQRSAARVIVYVQNQTVYQLFVETRRVILIQVSSNTLVWNRSVSVGESIAERLVHLS